MGLSRERSDLETFDISFAGRALFQRRVCKHWPAPNQAGIAGPMARAHLVVGAGSARIRKGEPGAVLLSHRARPGGL